MRTIWKFPIPLDATIEIKMPIGATLLTVQMQGSRPMLWAIVDPASDMVTRILRIAGTGTGEPEGRYVGTWQHHGYVWHLFDCGSRL